MLLATMPFVVYFALQHIQPRGVTLLLLLVLLLRAPRRSLRWLRARGWAAAPLSVLVAAAVVALWSSNDPIWVLSYPVAVNAVMLGVFAGSLLHPPNIIERIARLRTPDLPAAGVEYTRRVTMVWCLFFVVNGGIAMWTALAASREIWVLYNGMVSYLAMGCLFVGEWIYRLRFASAPQMEAMAANPPPSIQSSVDREILR